MPPFDKNSQTKKGTIFNLVKNYLFHKLYNKVIYFKNRLTYFFYTSKYLTHYLLLKYIAIKISVSILKTMIAPFKQPTLNLHKNIGYQRNVTITNCIKMYT